MKNEGREEKILHALYHIHMSLIKIEEQRPIVESKEGQEFLQSKSEIKEVYQKLKEKIEKLKL